MGLKIWAVHIFIESIQSWSQNKSSNKGASTSAQMDHATARKIIESLKNQYSFEPRYISKEQ